ncbi:MAG: hypothetical protein P8Z75_13715 [Gammaproteobacteria bacterium]|jgi:hypothetical protein
MNGSITFFLTTLFTLFFATATMAAPKALNHDEAVKLIKGNTAEGKNVKWNKSMLWYFADSGELRKLDAHGNKGKASWNINEKGELCYQDKHMNQEKCAAILPQEDGKYAVPIGNGGGWIWDKIVPGNPHNLGTH